MNCIAGAASALPLPAAPLLGHVDHVRALGRQRGGEELADRFVHHLRRCDIARDACAIGTARVAPRVWLAIEANRQRGQVLPQRLHPGVTFPATQVLWEARAATT